jgi:hypothetical protein
LIISNGILEKAETSLGKFIYSMFTKRLLSCPFAFARTWSRYAEPDKEPGADQNLLKLAEVSAQRSEDRVKSDQELSTLEDGAARYIGALLRKRGTWLQTL